MRVTRGNPADSRGRRVAEFPAAAQLGYREVPYGALASPALSRTSSYETPAAEPGAGHTSPPPVSHASATAKQSAQRTRETFTGRACCVITTAFGPSWTRLPTTGHRKLRPTAWEARAATAEHRPCDQTTVNRPDYHQPLLDPTSPGVKPADDSEPHRRPPTDSKTPTPDHHRKLRLPPEIRHPTLNRPSSPPAADPRPHLPRRWPLTIIPTSTTKQTAITTANGIR